jgi:hypothetical protein
MIAEAAEAAAALAAVVAISSCRRSSGRDHLLWCRAGVARFCGSTLLGSLGSSHAGWWRWSAGGCGGATGGERLRHSSAILQHCPPRSSQFFPWLRGSGSVAVLHAFLAGREVSDLCSLFAWPALAGSGRPKFENAVCLVLKI